MLLPNDDWYQVRNIDEVDSPALVVFPERVKNNIRLAIDMVGDVRRLRPHVKTNKSPQAVQMMLDEGIRKFKCATIAEAEILGQCKAEDVLLAYQPLGPKLDRFIQLIRKFPLTAFSCLTDSIEAAKEQSEAFCRHRLKVAVYIDVNVGMNRTGIVPGKELIDLYSYCYKTGGMSIKGLHVYDGHIRDNDIAERTENCNRAFELIEETKNELTKAGLPPPEIIAGGSPTFPVHALRRGVECSPGTFIYWDKGYSDLCPEQAFKPAAVLVTRIISLPAKNTICTDLGHKSVAAENSIDRRVFFLNADGLKPVGQSEEHLVVENTGTKIYKAGDVLYALPYHICPTVALYERVFTAKQGMVNGEWKNVGRDRKLEI